MCSFNLLSTDTRAEEDYDLCLRIYVSTRLLVGLRAGTTQELLGRFHKAWWEDGERAEEEPIKNGCVSKWELFLSISSMLRDVFPHFRQFVRE